MTSQVQRTTCPTSAYYTLDGLEIPNVDKEKEDVRYWLYVIVIGFACVQFILIVRYFFRLKGHFNRL